MLLIDRIVEAGPSHVVGEVLISDASPFFRKGHGVPAYVGIEYMAQTVAGFDGARRALTGEPPAIGFLLGTRRYISNVRYFLAGSHLTVRADMVFNENGMAVFDCVISVLGEELVKASLSVYRPENGQMELPEGIA
ncbi:MAG: 3-hydroxydecanoyl-ACP dehydratase [Pseudomonadota bacterium]